jgi:demethylmenaquinone methyltransferase / 2-methoxy-6-polyprenyl-1,4-benzoquinol methylase
MTPARGATPQGTETEEQAARYVRGMFGRVARRYDLLNHLLSLNVDRWWRARTVSRLRPILERPDARVLDLCCGTGDLTLALATRGSGFIIGSDFCHPMLTTARRKGAACLVEADALQLPFAAASLDLVSIAFGFRNFVNYGRGLAEIRRVLKPGGTLAILEFSTPPNPAFNACYQWYSIQVLPRIGALISGTSDAYTYLPESVRKFPDAPQLAQTLRDSGYLDVGFDRMTFGIVALHTGRAA